MIRHVEVSPAAARDLERVPLYIAEKLVGWMDEVEIRGLEEVRKVPGFHDEPLRGDRTGQRSIRLSRSYRAIYRVLRAGVVEFVSVEEVHKHAY